MNLTMVNLGYNKLKKMPSAVLRNTRMIGDLILDGNVFTKLETGAIHNVNIVRISVSVRFIFIATNFLKRFSEETDI